MVDEHGTDASDLAPKRRVVLHPRTAQARQIGRSRRVGTHVRGHAVDERGVFDHVRQQRRLAMQVVLPFLAALAVVLICFASFPALGRWDIGPVPIAWVLLGPVALFSILALGIWSERRARRLENDWIAARRQIVSRGAE